MSTLRSLLWKDLRLARGYLAAGFAVWIFPYAYLAWAWSRGAKTGGSFGLDVYHSGLIAGLGAIAVAALLAGGSFATERVDRSVEFLSYLPATRPVRLVSKGVVVVGPLVVLLACNPLICSPLLFDVQAPESGQHVETVITLVTTIVLVIGVAWLGSTLVGAAASLLLGLLSPFFVSCLFYFAALGIEDLGIAKVNLDDWFSPVFRWSGFILGSAAFLLGSIIFLAKDQQS